MSSPSSTTRSSTLISCRSAALIAPTMVISDMRGSYNALMTLRSRAAQTLGQLLAQMCGHLFKDVFENAFDAGGLRRLCTLDAAAQLRLDALFERDLIRGLEGALTLQVGAQTPQGVAPELLFHCSAFPVDVRIVRRRVRANAVRDHLDQRRAFAASRALDRAARDSVNRQRIVAVAAHGRNAVGDAFVCVRARVRLLLCGNADRPAV